MGIEVEAADMLVDAGEGFKALDGALITLPCTVWGRPGMSSTLLACLNPAYLHQQACVNHEAACQRGHNNGIMHCFTMALQNMSALWTCKGDGAPSLHVIHPLC